MTDVEQSNSTVCGPFIMHLEGLQCLSCEFERFPFDLATSDDEILRHLTFDVANWFGQFFPGCTHEEIFFP